MVEAASEAGAFSFFLFAFSASPARHSERSRPTFSSPFASCEWVGLRREESLRIRFSLCSSPRTLAGVRFQPRSLGATCNRLK
jgi:hypothetical protein